MRQIGNAVSVGDRGAPALHKDPSGNYQVPQVDASGNLKTVQADASGIVVSPPSSELIQTIQELISRLDGLAACKHHLTEAVRAQIVGAITLAVTLTSTNDATLTTTYMTPAYAKFLHHMAWGNQAAIQSNIQNVVV